jgi:hypothetical protein
MSEVALFDRRAAITVSRVTPLKAVRVTTPLRIQFKVEKQPYTPPNTADISITNLSRSTREGMEKFGAEVLLEAGYKGQVNVADGEEHYPVVFRGQARTIDHVRKGADWVTRIQCGDGETAYRYATVSKPFAPGTSLKDVSSFMAEQLRASGIDVRQFVTQLGDDKFSFPLQQFFSGYAAEGNPLQELEKLLAPNGWAVSIQNGELQVIGSSIGTPKPARLISPETGLLGSPEHGSPDKNGLSSILKLSTLLMPQLGPGDLFVLKARDNSGNYRAEKVTHTGDTHGEEWKTEIEARPLGAASDAAPTTVG